MSTKNRPDPKTIGFLILWIATATFFGWIGVTRLRFARETDQFDPLLLGLKRADWPALFGFMETFLMIWTGAAFFLTFCGLVWLTVLLAKALIGVFK